MYDILKLSLSLNEARKHIGHNIEQNKSTNTHSQKLGNDCMKPGLAYRIHLKSLVKQQMEFMK